jgi:hypothetical protein
MLGSVFVQCRLRPMTFDEVDAGQRLSRVRHHTTAK